MRASVTVTIPLDATAGQLRAVVQLLANIERGRWDALAATFDKMGREHALLADPVAAMVGAVAGGFRVASRERETALVAPGMGTAGAVASKSEAGLK